VGGFFGRCFASWLAFEAGEGVCEHLGDAAVAGFGSAARPKKRRGKKRRRAAALQRRRRKVAATKGNEDATLPTGRDKFRRDKPRPIRRRKAKDAGKMPALQKREADPSPPFPRQPLRPLAAGERRDWVPFGALRASGMTVGAFAEGATGFPSGRAKAGARPALHTEECCSHLTVAMLETSQDPSLRSG